MRQSAQLSFETLADRLTPSATAGPVLAVNRSVVDIIPAAHGDTAIYVTADPSNSKSLDVYLGSVKYVIPNASKLEVEVDGRNTAADSTVEFLIDSKNPVLALTGAGTSSLILGDGLSEVIAGKGSTNIIAGNGTELIYGAKNSTSVLNFVGGAGYNFIDVDGGTNYLDLGTGFSLVYIEGGTSYVTSQAGGAAIIIVDRFDATTTIDTTGASDWVIYVGC